MGNQKKIMCTINNIGGRSLTKKILEKMNAFTRLMHLLHLLPPNYAHALICLEDQKQEKKHNCSSCQTQGKGGRARQKKSKDRLSDNLKQKANAFASGRQAGFVSFFSSLGLKVNK